MNCRIADMRDKEVICIKDGSRLGCVGDVEIDINSGCLKSIIIFSKLHFLGFFSGSGDIIIDWCDIEVIGDDTILVKCEPEKKVRKKRRSILSE